jgi:hypothetical protein
MAPRAAAQDLDQPTLFEPRLAGGAFLFPKPSALIGDQIEDLLHTQAALAKLELFVLEGKYPGTEAENVTVCLHFLRQYRSAVVEKKIELQGLFAEREAKMPETTGSQPAAVR